MKRESLNQKLERVCSLLGFYLLLWNAREDVKLFNLSIQVLKKALRRSNSKEWYQEFRILYNLKYYRGIVDFIAKSADEQAKSFVLICSEAAKKGNYDTLLLHDAYGNVLSCVKERLILEPAGLHEAVSEIFAKD